MANIAPSKAPSRQAKIGSRTLSMWKLGGLSVVQLAKRLWVSMDEEHDDTFGRAAELAFWFFLAVFPGLLFLVTLLGLIAGKNPAVQNTLFLYIAKAMPPSAWLLVQQTLTQTANEAGGWKVVIGIFGALWSASAGVSTLMAVLNFACRVTERRPYWKSRLMIAMLLTIALAALMLGALGIILCGDMLALWTDQQGFGHAAVLAWRIAQWPVAALFVLLAFDVVYYWAPDLDNRRWHWIAPGSIAGMGLWIAASALFRVYLHFLNTYTAMYGSLATVIILLLWFYITSLSLLIGAEINVEIECAATEHERAAARLKSRSECPVE